MKINIVSFLVFAMIASCFSGKAAGAVWTISYPKPSNKSDVTFEYPMALLQLALEKSGVRFEIGLSDRVLNNDKALALIKDNREINLIWAITDLQKEEELLSIKLPIFKGLWGWRLLAIRQQQVPAFEAIYSIEALKGLTPVQSKDSLDNQVLQAGGFNLHSVSSIDAGYLELAVDNANFFPRSVVNIAKEVDNVDYDYNVVIEPTLALHYPSAAYFFVNRSNVTLARLIETGLQMAIDDGSFDKLFESYFQEELRRLNIEHRNVFELGNPQLPDSVPINKSRLWYRGACIDC